MSTPTTPAPAGDEPAVLADWLRRIAGDPELILASAERLKMRNAAAALERLAERVVRLEAALETAADEMASCETLASEPDAASLIRSWARRARAALQPQPQGGGDE